MKKNILLFAVSLFIAASASANTVNDDVERIQFNEQDLQPLSPTYLDDVYGSHPWGSNWFISIKGGMSAFIGKPVGHGDFFDRKKFMLNAAIGKWFNPYFGARASFQGFKLYDSNLQSRNFQNIHVDLMYNFTSHFRTAFETLPRWNVIPYLGCGIIHLGNENGVTSLDNKPFAMSYGVIAQYRFAPRLYIEGELGGTTTWQSFDGIGANNKLGDNLLHASIGLNFIIGKAGYRRVIDPKPYILQNDILMEYLDDMKDENDRLNQKQKQDAMALAEMRKILEIEGLLEKYNLELPESEQKKTFPKNNYSGLNSLRARLRDKNNETVSTAKTIDKEIQPAAFSGVMIEEAEMTPEDYFQVMKDGKVFIGSPIFFFFKLAKDELTEKAQMINIREIASTIKRFGLSARIVGAADSQTGTAVINERLSAKRADYIAKLLRENGVPEERITTQFQGGISTYVPMEGNRNTCVMLYFN